MNRAKRREKFSAGCHQDREDGKHPAALAVPCGPVWAPLWKSKSKPRQSMEAVDRDY